ncbi:HBR232Wp [Eremothecium sinecaudum]|uniref:HBR232Wp n=1 Tax=Eremothecium sinecaudum TaxID=45286 RepID=A0A109UX77_9SACH|nr:HBR232Wp [Eremothecium sinecaudum]AMD19133.1 HBR232Wp [Eremothecium sinecaudum]
MDSQLKALTLKEPIEYVDITDCLKNLTNKLDAKSIIKDSSFDLFEGTHALEINNCKLDSTLLDLPAEDIEFSCNIAYGKTKAERISYVTSIVDKLSRSIMDWLNDYQSLPTTVLSCQYLEYLSMKYKESGNVTLTSMHLNTGCDLYDQVLSSCATAAIYMINFASSLLRAGVIYQEEDLNCYTMGLEILTEVLIDDVAAELRKTITVLKTKFPDAKRLMQLVLLFDNLLKIPDYRPLIEFPPSDNMQPLHDLIEIAEKLEAEEWTGVVPPGSFSQVIQKRLSNHFPPKALYESSSGQFKAYANMAADILTVLNVRNAVTVFEIRQFAWFFEKCKQRHVVARALFPLYLMRDDQSVLGVYSFTDFTYQTLMQFSLCASKLEQSAPEELEEIQLELDKFYQEMSSINFEWYQNLSQNVCRYRQGYNRQVLLWDSLQANLQHFEMTLESKGLVDELPDGPFFPLNTWVYFMKVTAMLEYILKGFDLEVYKPWESFTMNWYVYYLCNSLECCYERVRAFAEQKITSIRAMNKKLKKMKSGPRKDSLKQTYQRVMATTMPQLRYNVQCINFLAKDCEIMKAIALAQVFQFGILRSFKIIDNKHPGDIKFTSDELLHDLRFKSFSSIGVPKLPDHGAFQETLEAFTPSNPNFESKLKTSVLLLNEELDAADDAVTLLLKCINTEDKSHTDIATGTRLVSEEAVEWYTSIKMSIDAIRSNADDTLEKLGSKTSNNNSTAYRGSLKYLPGTCRFFPLLKVETIE